jgi:hypothetical protein
MYQHFDNLDERTKEYRWFSTEGREIPVGLKPPSDTETDPFSHFLASVDELFAYAL